MILVNYSNICRVFVSVRLRGGEFLKFKLWTLEFEWSTLIRMLIPMCTDRNVNLIMWSNADLIVTQRVLNDRLWINHEPWPIHRIHADWPRLTFLSKTNILTAHDVHNCKLQINTVTNRYIDQLIDFCQTSGWRPIENMDNSQWFSIWSIWY